ncbi:MAG: hypothetical protein H6716_18070 [Polyangiaceae bacterium]|nr:hypothetical protein [Polyangiaceae bacterium]
MGFLNEFGLDRSSGFQGRQARSAKAVEERARLSSWAAEEAVVLAAAAVLAAVDRGGGGSIALVVIYTEAGMTDCYSTHPRQATAGRRRTQPDGMDSGTGGNSFPTGVAAGGNGNKGRQGQTVRPAAIAVISASRVPLRLLATPVPHRVQALKRPMRSVRAGEPPSGDVVGISRAS